MITLASPFSVYQIFCYICWWLYLFFWNSQGLYLGSIGAANNNSGLKSLNITHILTVANSLSPPHPNDFTYKIVGGRKLLTLIHTLNYRITLHFIDSEKHATSNKIWTLDLNNKDACLTTLSHDFKMY